ncbi:hypothetical protein GGR56DRAFT_14983 [Xylariaceae sp. FL0804]|nr:hypothetical protein GGR56DRAFT_14983 [Xylariaceae sp. FL0804]
MPGPASPNEGPTYEPPTFPAGWIAQWDSNSKKYYYVQLSTGVSQWETPTDAAPVGTPAQANEHPFGVPGQQELITHPDGTQTIKHPDGRMEPIMPPEASEGEPDGPAGERGLGSFAANALMNQYGSHGNQHGGSSSGSGGLGKLAGQLLGGHNGSTNGHGGGGGAGKLVGQLASNLFSSGHKPQQPQDYHSGGHAQQSHQSGGLADSVMGGVSNMFGGSHGNGQSGNYGYSNSGQSGAYSGQAPPTSYQPGSTPSYNSSAPNQHAHPSYSHASSQHATPAYAPSPGQQHAQLNPSYGGVSHSSTPQSGYGHSPVMGHAYPQQHQYSSPPPHQPSYAGQPQYHPPASTYGQQYPPASGPPQFDGPPAPSGAHPHHQGGQGGYPGNW